MGKFKIPHTKSNLKTRIIVGFQNFWMFWKVDSTCVPLAHKPLGALEILFKNFSNENENFDYFRENPSS